jgi:uracil-DNA glycosylase
MIPHIFESYWYNALYDEYRQKYFLELEAFLAQEKKDGKVILPFPNTRIFQAFELCSLNKVKVVILGQDPYIGLSQAQGLAFSVSNTCPIPPNLKNIYRELKSDTGIVNDTGDLSHWAVQGVFLLNTVLTVEQGKSGSHVNIGWEEFTDAALIATCKLRRPVVYWLLGKHAQLKKDLINAYREGPTLIIETPHPFPLSAHRGFFWSKPFSRTNSFLMKHGQQPINWKL